MRINGVCLLGAILGIVSLTVPCVAVTIEHSSLFSNGRITYSHLFLYLTSSAFTGPEADLGNLMTKAPPEFLLAPTAFLLGIALSLITPLGGLSMALGMVEYGRIVGSNDFNAMFASTGSAATSIHWGAALYIGILATILVLLSVLLPFGPGHTSIRDVLSFNRNHLKERLLVWGRDTKSRP